MTVEQTSMAKRVLILGSDGQLAQAIAAGVPASVHCVARNHGELDICDHAEVEAVVQEVQPDLVVNGAAYNAVDAAERIGFDLAARVNTAGVESLAAACDAAGIPLVHFSTDLVFDGSKRAPYIEEDIANPLGRYGATKLAGEEIALAASNRNYVIRVCRLFGPFFSHNQGSAKKPYGNFPLLMLRLAREKGQVRVVNDQVGSPTYTPDLAQAIWRLTDCAPGGLYQLSNAGEVSFSDYAAEIFRVASVTCDIGAVSSKEYGGAAARPLYSVINNTKAHAAGVTPLRHWSEALEEFLTRS